MKRMRETCEKGERNMLKGLEKHVNWVGMIEA